MHSVTTETKANINDVTMETNMTVEMNADNLKTMFQEENKYLDVCFFGQIPK